MDTLKSFLVTRLIAVLAAVLAAELLVNEIVRSVILPFALAAARMEKPAELRTGEILFTIYSLISGRGQITAAGVLYRSGAAVLLLLALFLLAAPVAAGIAVYASLVTARVDELEKQREEERRAFDEERNLMLSDFAHDLRTPVMTITGYAGALQDGLLEDEDTRAEYIDAIRRKSERLGELINLLFEYVRLGSANFRLNLAECDINELVAETAAALYTDIEEAGMELIADVPEEPFPADADRAQAGRILNNLLINAMRHNPAGTTIALSVRRLSGMEIIAVADSGVKIEGDPEKLFEPFVKGDGSRSGGQGSGLGLSISRRIAEMHGWTLTLEQPYGEYTKAFTLSVPERSS